MTLRQAVGRRIRELRKARGWRQAELGRRLARPVSHAFVSYIEAGKTGLDVDELASVASALGTDLGDLLGCALPDPDERLRQENDRLRTALRLIGAQAEIAAGLAGSDGQ